MRERIQDSAPKRVTTLLFLSPQNYASIFDLLTITNLAAGQPATAGRAAGRQQRDKSNNGKTHFLSNPYVTATRPQKNGRAFAPKKKAEYAAKGARRWQNPQPGKR
jgi:hypothetical protein